MTVNPPLSWFPCRFAFLMMSLLAVATSPARGEAVRYDVVLKNGTIHPGDGSESFTGTIGIRESKIAVIETDAELEGDIEIDCSGLIVCPGFIDLHNHSDRPILRRNTRANINYLLQGCTTVITGNCGSGHVDVAEYFETLDKEGAGTHVIHLLPQGSLRNQVLGMVNRNATPEELAQMLELAEKAMQDGAYGMSTGLIYIPGNFTPTSELVEIAKVVARHGGIYASHIRNEGPNLLASVQEAIQIGAESGAAVHVSHFKASGKPAWGTLRLAIDMIEKARASGQTVTADQYPYPASSTSLEAILLPTWSREGGSAGLRKRLKDPETTAKIREEVLQQIDRCGRIQLVSAGGKAERIGKSLDEIAQKEGKEVIDLVFEIVRSGGAAAVHFGMQEEEVRSAMPLPWLATATDGGAKTPSASRPHPRSFGTFPRKVGYYALEQDVLPLAAAIRSCSGLPAEILGLTDRGLLKPGLAADITIFDPETFRDRATFDEPYLTPSGIRYVLVEGQFAVHGGQATGILNGRALRKTTQPAATQQESTAGGD